MIGRGGGLALMALAVLSGMHARASTPADASPSQTLPVRVQILENVRAGAELELTARQPVESYGEPAFGFPRIPVK
jgi:hypothetical protein